MIDVHTHAIPSPAVAASLPEDVFAFRDAGGGAYDVHVDGQRVRTVDATAFDVTARAALMTTERVTHQLVSPAPFLFRYAADPASTRQLARATNRHIADIVSADSERFSGLGSVTLQDTTHAVEDLHDALDLGLTGVEIGTHLPDRELDDPTLEPFWQAAHDSGVLVFVHPYASRLADPNRPAERFALGYPMATAQAFTAMVTGRLPDRFSDIRWLLAHGGGCAPAVAGRLQQASAALGQPYPAPLAALRSCWVDGLVYLPEQLAALITLMGVDRVVLGTDFPFAAREQPPGATIAAAQAAGLIGEEIAGRLRTDNARALLTSERR